jgi:NADPH2:quinone reductase
MRAMVATAWGEPSAMRYREAADPVPGPGEVLVETRAVGCNFADILMVRGQYQVKPPLPFSPGFEAAGVVQAVGPGVTGVGPGRRVLALLGWGAYAELALGAATQVFPIPDPMPFEEAAALGITYQTSYCALVHRASLRAGEWLLVHAAAGGVGLAAVQIGKALGAHVIATAGTDAKLEIAREAGADVLLNYRRGDWVERVKTATGGAGADVVYDPVGADVFDASTKCLASEGRLLTIGFAGGRIPSIAANRILLKNIAVVGVHWGLYQKRGSPLIHDWMAALFRLYEAGKVRPVIYRTYRLPEAARALQALGSRESHGKVLLLP